MDSQIVEAIKICQHQEFYARSASDITVSPALELVTHAPPLPPSYVFEEILIKIVVCLLILPPVSIFTTLSYM